MRVTKSSELAGALSHGLSHDGVSLIEVMVNSAVPLLYAQKGYRIILIHVIASAAG